MKLPGPDHPIDIAANPKRVQVDFQGHLLADTTGALALTEASYPPVQYIPREDVEMAFLARTEHHSYCPYKGQASYYSIARDGVIAENAVWSYEDPYPAMALIKGHLAFYPNHVAIHELDSPSAEAIGDVITHTDDGAGTSQAEHWPANVDGPVSEGLPAIDRPHGASGAI